jgi:hypothetical protein
MMYYGDRDVDCVSKLMEEEFSRLRAYCLVSPLSQHVPPQFWEYEQPYIDNIILNAARLQDVSCSGTSELGRR